MLPVSGLGFRGRFWAGCGRKPSANRPETDPKLPGPEALAIWDRRFVAKAGPKLSPVPGPEALLNRLK